MGDRDRHRHRVYLSDLRQSLPREPRNFVDLACGTGYFTEVFFELFPAIHGMWLRSFWTHAWEAGRDQAVMLSRSPIWR
jgi:hypothetical protein